MERLRIGPPSAHGDDGGGAMLVMIVTCVLMFFGGLKLTDGDTTAWTYVGWGLMVLAPALFVFGIIGAIRAGDL